MYTSQAIRIILSIAALLILAPILLELLLGLLKVFLTIPTLGLVWAFPEGKKKSFREMYKYLALFLVALIPIYYFALISNNPYEGKGSFAAKSAHYFKTVTKYPMSGFLWSAAKIGAYEHDCKEVARLKIDLKEKPERAEIITKNIQERQERIEQFEQGQLLEHQRRMVTAACSPDDPQRLKYENGE